jgi:Ca2+-transporting ATPase
MPEWYRLSGSQAIETLKTDPSSGLTSSEVVARRERFGWNELKERPGQTIWQKLASQFKEFLVLLLVIAAVISLLLGEASDALVIFLVVVINAVLGVFQEFKAEKSLAALKTLSAPTAKVFREGEATSVAARQLVPGDLILLEAGDLVPADARLLEADNLQINESALTGESVPVEKAPEFTAMGVTPLAERRNMLFMSTIATFGRGRALVTATGMETEIGRIAGMIQEVEPEKTPLQKKLADFGKQMGLLAIGICLLIFIVGLLRGNRFYEMFLVSVSLAVAAIPEGLPAIVTIVLALGVQRMARQKAIIRRLPAVETLGSATVICSDKTGTLTQNAMTVQRVLTGTDSYEVTGQGFNNEGKFLNNGTPVEIKQEPLLSLILKIGVLCNDADLSYKEEEKMIGDPTEGALLIVAEKAGYHRQNLRKDYPRIKEYPFDSVRKRMSTVHRGNLSSIITEKAEEEELWLLTKGAPDLVLEKSRWWLGSDSPHELTPEKKKEFLDWNKKLAAEALRVLGFALRPYPAPGFTSVDEGEQELTFVGFMGMLDPERPEAKAAIKVCHQAGIEVKMITGDHRDTARAIAGKLGLLANEDQILTGEELDVISREELEKKVGQIRVYARVSPEHKVKIIEALKANGEVVAMTGDGVNDAPALKRADIGAAMGRTGTDVAKEAAEMVLADDNFVTIVHAVQEGRVIFENIKKAVYFLLSCNVGELLTIFTAILLGWPIPLYPIQILWINLVTDTLPALSLGVDPPEGDIMKRPPLNPEQGIFGPKVKLSIAAFGAFIACITLLAFRLGLRQSVAKGETMAFATLGISQLVHAFNYRSLTQSLWRRGFLKNKYLLLGIVVSASLQLLVFFIPFLMRIFRVQSLSVSEWMMVMSLVLAPLFFGELWKLIFKGDCRA